MLDAWGVEVDARDARLAAPARMTMPVFGRTEKADLSHIDDLHQIKSPNLVK
jgi:hypothetical protein